MGKKSHIWQDSGWSLDHRNSHVIRMLMPLWEWQYHHYFRVQSNGWHHVDPQKRVLFVGSHNGGVAAPDMFMMIYEWFHRFGDHHPIYGLMHPGVWKVSPVLAHIAAQVGAIQAHPKMAIAALRQGASVLVYPGGARDVFRPHALRHKIYLDNNQAFIKLALQENVPIVPLISYGAHDTFIVLADLYEQVRRLHEWGMPWLFNVDPETFPVYLGLPWGIGIGPLPHIPLPVQVHTQICEPIVFEVYGQEAARDRAYVNECYNQVYIRMQQAMNDLVFRVEKAEDQGRRGKAEGSLS